MSVTEIAGFLLKSYKTLQDMARKTTTFQREINGLSVVQAELIIVYGLYVPKQSLRKISLEDNLTH